MRSDLIKEGPSRAPHRSLLRALGIDDLEMKRPFVAVVNSKSDYIPGHMHLDKIAEQVKAGIRNAGGVPFEFNTIGVCDGIAMNHKGMKYSLCSRELIADSIEVMLTAHPLDAIVFIPNCDKIVPGMLLAACRLNLPCIFISGGPMLPGKSAVTGGRIGLSEQFGRQCSGQNERPDFGELCLYCLPHLRQLLRYVHRQFHELPDRDHRHVPARLRYHSGCNERSSAPGKRGR